MVHILITTHGGLARELLRTAELIVGTQPDLAPICLEPHEGIEDIKQKLLEYLRRHQTDADGFLVLVDMFGGTPSNVALELAQTHPIRVVTGVNLPMLLETITHRLLMDLPALAEFVHKKGKQSIIQANDLFKEADGGS